MNFTGSPGIAAIPAAAAAGPLFMIGISAAHLYGGLPRPIVVAPEEFLLFAFSLVPAALIGFVIAYLPILVGTLLMRALSERSAFAREPIVWMGAGAALVAAIIMLIDAEIGGAGSFALIATGAACAGLCRRQFTWYPEPRQAYKSTASQSHITASRSGVR